MPWATVGCWPIEICGLGVIGGLAGGAVCAACCCITRWLVPYIRPQPEQRPNSRSMLVPHLGQLRRSCVTGTPDDCWSMAGCEEGCGFAFETLGVGIACGLADAAGVGDGIVEPCCSVMHRNPHFGQNLDLWGRGSRQ